MGSTSCPYCNRQIQLSSRLLSCSCGARLIPRYHFYETSDDWRDGKWGIYWGGEWELIDYDKQQMPEPTL